MRTLLVPLVLTLLVAIAPVSADENDVDDNDFDEVGEIEEARELKAKLKYREALDIVKELLAEGDANPDELAEMHLLAGELLAGLSEADSAAMHFASYLALVPDGALEAGASPKLADPFIAAKSELAGRALGAAHKVANGTLEVIVDDPRNMVRAVEVRLGGEKSRVEGGPYRFPLPATRPLSVHIQVLDEHGNQLVVLGEEPLPIVIDSKKRSIVTRPMTWAIASGAAGAAAVTFALLARSAQSELDDLIDQSLTVEVSFDEIRAVEDRARSRALATNISMSVAGLTAVTALTLWWLQKNEAKPQEPTVSVQWGEGRTLTIGARAHF